MTGRVMDTAVEAAYQQAVDAAAKALLGMDWEVREVKTALRIVPVDWPDSAGAMAMVQKREGRVALNRKIADAIAMLPRIVRLLDEAVVCIGELLDELPAGALVPPRVVTFLSRVAAAEAAEMDRVSGQHAQPYKR
jgi:hypothetical protein